MAFGNEKTERIKPIFQKVLLTLHNICIECSSVFYNKIAFEIVLE